MNRNHFRGHLRRVRPFGVTTLAVAGAASLLLVTGCGSDDDDASESATTEAAADTTEAPDATVVPAVDSSEPMTDDVDMTAACDAWIEADSAIIGFQFAEQGDADTVNGALDDAIAAADPANEQTLVDLKASAQDQLADPESDGNEETLGLYADAIGWAGESCDVDTLDVSAVDYGFEGLPETLTTGYHVVNFTNTGNENHEMFAIRFNEGTTESMDELFELPEEEAFTKITPVNATFAPSGSTETVSWNLAEPGRYAIFCAIPVGTVGEAEGDGPPHFTQGMIQEFTVA